MLKRLFINHFAIIDELEFEFESGFNVFTGETGAGKSIIIDAISYLMGRQGNEDAIKAGHPVAIVEGVFHVPPEIMTDEHREFLDDANDLIVLRKLSRKSGSSAKINNQTVTLKKLKELIGPLLSIIGQHEHLNLFHQEHQLNLLDAYAGPAVSELKHTYRQDYHHYLACQRELEKIKKEQLEITQKKDFLTFQIQDIDHHQFQPDEEETLAGQKKQIQALDQTRHSLSQLSTHFHAINERLFQCVQESEALSRDTDFRSMTANLKDFSLSIEDHQSLVRQRTEQLHLLDDMDINAIESRLHTIFKIRTKYHSQTLPLLLEKRQVLQHQLDQLNNIDAQAEATTDRLKTLEVQLYQLADQIHARRLQSATELSKHILMHMADLGLEHSQFEVRLQTHPEKLTDTGYDAVSFLVSTNPGQPVCAIEKVASGGEVSRMMLAIRTILTEKYHTFTYIFDEIDTGVGGLTAIKIGEKLQIIAEKSQVFCVTHLPQIAKFAHQHYVITKHSNEDSTTTRVIRLNKDDTREELKRMVGGEAVLKEL